MGNKIVVKKGHVEEVFEDVLGHQVGNGAVQVLERSGNQRIINAFDDVTVVLDEEAAEKFAKDLEVMEDPVEEEVDPSQVEDTDEASGDNVVPLH